MEQLITIRSPAAMASLKKYLADKDYVSFDTETTGVEKGSEIIGFSVCADPEIGYYVVLSEWVIDLKKLVDLETKAAAKEFLTYLKTKQLVMQNAVFDCSMVADSYGVSLIEHVHTDTMLLAHILDENRPCGLKELGIAIFGEDAGKEQAEMKASVTANGGTLTKNCYELYKADSELIARYGAKDAILTLKLFYHMVPQLFEQGLDKFFYDEETMPLLRGPTYQLNTEGLRVDTDALSRLRSSLEADVMEARAYIYKEIIPIVQAVYPGTSKAKTFNIGASQQLAWLLFEQLKQPFHTLTDEGKAVCKYLGLRLPYALADKRAFMTECTAAMGKIYCLAAGGAREKKIGVWWKYVKADKETVARYADKYKWVKAFQKYNKDLKLLSTYVYGIEHRMRYGIVRPSFLQHGTTSGRYASRNPNFQNLPRDDARIKACIVARPGKVFVGADQSQLEVRVFAAMSQDSPLLASFLTGEDFYSVIGMTIFGKSDCTPYKDGSPDAFGVKYKRLRDVAKVVALSATYGTTAPKMAPAIGKSIEEAQEIIDDYFNSFPGVRQFQLESHKQAKENGYVCNYFGRPRRMPEAKKIPKRATHDKLSYDQRNLLNLSVNHRVQSTAASVMNRCAIAVYNKCKQANLDVKIVTQIHDELVLECPEQQAEQVAAMLKESMENTVQLPGVGFIAEPKIARSLKELK